MRLTKNGGHTPGWSKRQYRSGYTFCDTLLDLARPRTHRTAVVDLSPWALIPPLVQIYAFVGILPHLSYGVVMRSMLEWSICTVVVMVLNAL